MKGAEGAQLQTSRPEVGVASAFVTVRCPFCLTPNRMDLARVQDRPKCGECERPILLDRPIRVTGEDFAKTVLEAEVPVLVDFYADWCAPCKAMAPILDDVAREKTGSVLVAKLDTDAAPEIAQQYGIRAIPTLMLFRKGTEAERLIGLVKKSDILQALERVQVSS